MWKRSKVIGRIFFFKLESCWCVAAKLTAPWQPIQLLNNASCVRCSGWSNDAITWGNPIRYADSVQTNTNSNRISRLLTLDPRFEGVRIQCVRLHDRAIPSRGSPGSHKLESVCTWPEDTELSHVPTSPGLSEDTELSHVPTSPGVSEDTE